MANRANILKLIDWLESGKGPKFHMDSFFYVGDYDTSVEADAEGHDVEAAEWEEKKDDFAHENWCGTQACIAGHAVVLARSEGYDLGKMTPENGWDEMAAKYLGLNSMESGEMFYSWNDPNSVNEAIRKLKVFLD